jgi:NADH-quinone oxidoreductase subunit L
MLNSVWLVPLCPLVGAALNSFFGQRYSRQTVGQIAIASVGLAFLVSLMTLVAFLSGTASQHQVLLFTWIASGAYSASVGFLVDGLSLTMMLVVSGVGLLIHIYSTGYMHDEPDYARYFTYLNLFVGAMLILVMADNYLLMFVGWEGVGLCSYLLIGFWYTRQSAADAGKKAFIVNRIGDFGFMLAVLLMFVTFQTTDMLGVQSKLAHAQIGAGVLTAIALLLFMGAVGKSAQVPLYVWLPDAMEGPTPVSALIHAATMVTAGVYMVARFTPLFAAAPTAQLWVAGMGGFTALLAALIALTQTDLKRILAYSTVSQLGYMFLALGTGTAGGAIAAIFHVFTHAFFKALLFLGAGSVMHAMGNVIDIRRFGGLRARMPITCWTFAAGAASLAGLPLLSGFWSKDEILAGVAARAHDRTFYGVLLAAALATAFLTAFYTFRAFFKAFWGDEVIPPEAGHHAHESPPMMYYPLIVLAVFAVLIGAILGPTGLLHSFLSRTPGLTAAHAEPTHMNPSLMGIASVLAVGGIGLAWGLYGRRTMLPLVLAAKLRPAYELSRNKFWFDEIYTAFIIRPALLLAAIARIADRMIVDSLVDFVAAIPAWFGRYLVRPIQNGLVQFYALAMLMGIVVLVLAMLLG